MGEVIRFGGRGREPTPPPIPPAPDPDNGLCATWGELIDTWMYLCDTGEYWTLRAQLKAWSVACEGIPLPDGVLGDPEEE
jgi:hypothetical protein